MRKSPCAAASPCGVFSANILSGLLFPLNDALVLPLLAVSIRAVVLSLHCLPCCRKSAFFPIHFRKGQVRGAGRSGGSCVLEWTQRQQGMCDGRVGEDSKCHEIFSKISTCQKAALHKLHSLTPALFPTWDCTCRGGICRVCSIPSQTGAVSRACWSQIGSALRGANPNLFVALSQRQAWKGSGKDMVRIEMR